MILAALLLAVCSSPQEISHDPVITKTVVAQDSRYPGVTLSLKFRVAGPNSDAATSGGTVTPPIGHFSAQWYSGGVLIHCEATQRDDESNDAFATRCKSLLEAQLRVFKKDPLRVGTSLQGGVGEYDGDLFTASWTMDHGTILIAIDSTRPAGLRWHPFIAYCTDLLEQMVEAMPSEGHI